MGCAAADGRPRWLAPTTNRFTCAAKARLVCYGRFRGGKRKRRDKRLMGGELTIERPGDLLINLTSAIRERGDHETGA